MIKDNEEILKSQEELFSKVSDRLSTPCNTDINCITLYDIDMILKDKFNNYNAYLKTWLDASKKSINKHFRKKNIFKKKLPYISCISPIILENGEISINIVFSNSKGKYMGNATIDENNNFEVNSLNSIYSLKDLENEFNVFSSFFPLSLDALKNFRMEFPNTKYEWSNDFKDGIKYDFDDGFIRWHFDSIYPNKSYIVLSNRQDMLTSATYTTKYGQLYDYIEFYKNNLMKNTSVCLDDLEENLRRIVEIDRIEKDVEYIRKLEKDDTSIIYF